MIISAGASFESIIEQTMNLSNVFADQQARIKQMEENIALLSNLKDINQYMGTTMVIADIIVMINDVILGVLGAASSVIVLKKDDQWATYEKNIFQHETPLIAMNQLDELQTLLETHAGAYKVSDLSARPLFNRREGYFSAYQIIRNEIVLGMIAIYAHQPDFLTDIKQEFFRQITLQLGVHLENAYLFETLSRMTRTDGLTHLYNRSYMDVLMSKEEYHDSNTLGVIMVDIDRFKLINDHFGHIFGDSVIRKLANVCKDISKKYSVNR